MRIAFGCKAGSGKDTACSYLQSRHGGVITRFAAPIYDIMYFAQDRAGIPRHKDRRFLRWIGTTWGRAQNPDIWVNAVIDDVRALSEDTNVFIADVRFPNEFDALRKEGFLLVRINRPRDDTQVEEDISETALDDNVSWDCVISNSGTIEGLHDMLNRFVQRYTHE